MHLCLKLESCDDVFVDEAWAIEAVQHGDSGLINYDKLGLLCELKSNTRRPRFNSFAVDWSEHARDLLNFLLNYMPDRSSSAPSLPVHLPAFPKVPATSGVILGLVTERSSPSGTRSEDALRAHNHLASFISYRSLVSVLSRQ